MKKKLLFCFLVATTFMQGQLQQLSFNDSEDDRVRIPSNPSYELDTNSFTIEAVIKASEIQSNTFPMIVSKRGNAAFSGFFLALNRVGSDYYPFIQIDGLNLFSGLRNGNPLNDEKCHHVVGRRDDNVVSIFVDGTMVVSGNIAATRSINNNADIVIGNDEARADNTNFNGIIGEVRFWNIARNDQEIANSSLVTLSETDRTGLVGYWKLNRIGTNQVAKDTSVTANDGFLGDSNDMESLDPQILEGNCVSDPQLKFIQFSFTDTEEDRITIPANPRYELGTNSFTIEAVINASKTQNNRFPMIVSKRGDAEFSGFFLALNQVGSDYYPFIQIDGLNLFAGAANGNPLNDEECHHVVGKRDGNFVSILVDGAVVASGNISPSRTINNNADIFIGNDEARIDQTSFNGIISEVRFWENARSDQDIANSSLVSLTDTDRSGLIGYWKLNELLGEQIIEDASTLSNNGFLGTTEEIESTDPVILEGSCIDFELNVESIVGAKDISIYPNPFVNEITISNTDNGRYRIFSIEGRLLTSGNFKRGEAILVPSDMSSGTYIFRVESTNGTSYVKKVIKK